MEADKMALAKEFSLFDIDDDLEDDGLNDLDDPSVPVAQVAAREFVR